MVRLLPVLTAIPVAIAFGIVEGIWTNRWTHDEATEAAVARLADVPLKVGPWEGQASELDEKQIQVAQIKGYLMRRYTHRVSRSTVSVLIVCGRPGPISVHTPDVCYGGAGYDPVAEPAHRSVATDAPAKPAEFWTANFYKRAAALPEPLRIYWSWSATGDWAAPDSPRLKFARAPALYKMYVIRQLTRPDEPLDNDPAADFLRLFLPELQKCLFENPQP
jgi:hypothetical protein